MPNISPIEAVSHADGEALGALARLHALRALARQERTTGSRLRQRCSAPNWCWSIATACRRLSSFRLLSPTKRQAEGRAELFEQYRAWDRPKMSNRRGCFSRRSAFRRNIECSPVRAVVPLLNARDVREDLIRNDAVEARPYTVTRFSVSTTISGNCCSSQVAICLSSSRFARHSAATSLSPNSFAAAINAWYAPISKYSAA
jgi:hypothetical protein